MNTTKICSHCKVEKPLADFQKNRVMADGYGNQCKACHNEYSKRYRQDPECRARSKEYHAIRYRERLAENGYSLESRERILKKQYGITLQDYVRILVSQNQKCAICGSETPDRGGAESFDVDHDHATGKVRGLLCKHCNLMLGNAKDSTSTLESAITYLKKHQ